MRPAMPFCQRTGQLFYSGFTCFFVAGKQVDSADRRAGQQDERDRAYPGIGARREKAVEY